MRIHIIGDVHIGNQVSTRTDNYFETCKQKLRTVLNSCDIAIFLGDIFNTPVIDTGKLFEICGLFMEYPNVKKYTILGNHDVYNMNENTLYKTSLGLLELMGLITVINPHQNITWNNLTIGTMPLNFDKANPNNATIILGHHFYGLNCSESFSEEDFDRLYPNAKYIFLGHDHQHYEPSGRVYRPGSLLRNAATDYNRSRKPMIYVLDSETLELSDFEVPSQDGNSIFVDNLNLKKRERFIETLERTINLYSETVEQASKNSMVEILKEIKTPRDVMDYIAQTCKVLGVPLK